MKKTKLFPTLAACVALLSQTVVSAAQSDTTVVIGDNNETFIAPSLKSTILSGVLPYDATRLPNSARLPVYLKMTNFESDGMQVVLQQYNYDQNLSPVTVQQPQNARLLPKDVLGNVAGGYAPVINYRRLLISDSGACNDQMDKWDGTIDIEPTTGVAAVRLSDDAPDCLLQGALDSAVALVRFHPYLYPRGERETQKFINEVNAYKRAGLINNDAVIMAQKSNYMELYFGTPDAPLFLIVSAYPGMRHAFQDSTFDTMIDPKRPVVTFYFFPISPRMATCIIRGWVTPPWDTEDEDVYYPAACNFLITPLRVTVAYNADKKQWQLKELPFYRVQYLFPSAASYGGWIEHPTSIWDALAKYYPPIRRWQQALDAGRPYRLQSADFSLPLSRYSFAPGYMLITPPTPTVITQTLRIPKTILEYYIARTPDESIPEDVLFGSLMLNVRGGNLEWFPSMRFRDGISITSQHKVISGTVHRVVHQSRFNSSNDALLVIHYPDKLPPQARLYRYAENKTYDVTLNNKGDISACVLRKVSPDLVSPFSMLFNFIIPAVNSPQTKRLPGQNLAFEVPMVYGPENVNSYIEFEGMSNRVKKLRLNAQMPDTDPNNVPPSSGYVDLEVAYNGNIDNVVSLCQKSEFALNADARALSEHIGVPVDALLVLEWEAGKNNTVAFVNASYSTAVRTIKRALESGEKAKLIEHQIGKESQTDVFIYQPNGSNTQRFLSVANHTLVLPDNSQRKGTLLRVGFLRP